MNKLPGKVRESLELTVEVACELAASGQVSLGRDCLLVGLKWASEAAQSGVPWAEALTDHYHDALQQYGERFGQPPASVAKPQPAPAIAGVG